MNTRDLEPYNTIVVNLGELIRGALIDAASEQYHPGADSDRSDETIADALKRAKELRRIRDEFETLLTEAILS